MKLLTKDPPLRCPHADASFRNRRILDHLIATGVPGCIVRHFIDIAVHLAALVLLRSGALAQDLEPRAYSNSPTGLNFVIAGYGCAKGSVLTDPSLPLDNVTNEANIGVFAFATTLNVLGNSGKFDMIVPYGSLYAKGLAYGQPRERYVEGFGDPLFRLSMDFIGAPALSAAEFKDYRQNFILGASLRVSAPLGQYDSDKLVNIGANRWAFKPEIGLSKAIGKWTLELAPAVTCYTDNNDFFGGQTREVAPIYSLQSGVIYTFVPSCWLALNAGYYVGGRSTVDGVKNNDVQEGMRFGVTLAIPLNRNYSVKFYGVTGYSAQCVHDFETVGVALQYRWGGGF